MEQRQAQAEAEKRKKQESSQAKVTPLFENIVAANFTTEVVDSQSGWLVYFTTLPAGEDVSSEYKAFKKLARAIKGITKVGVFHLEKSLDSFEALRKEYKVPTLDEGKPKMRYLPNGMDGQ